MGLTLSDRLKVREDVMFSPLSGEAVLLDLKSGTYFGLNPVGARIWQLLEDGQSLLHVLDTLEAEYDARRDELERGVMSLAEDLLARDLVAQRG